ncbi:ArnT family glycosyltransferase [Amycolatopsis sp. NPDC004378]
MTVSAAESGTRADTTNEPGPSKPGYGRAEIVALSVLLLGTAAILLWQLSEAGWGNSYYASAVQGMSQSWKAFLFGSFDAENAITVDKPPAGLWLMALSARLFGFSVLSVLVPQVLLGVGSVAVLHAAVRRAAGPLGGLIAGAALAVTPVAVMIFRYDNPDVVLVFVLVAAAYAVVRALEKGSTRWLVVAGVFVGLAVLTKMGQGLLTLPAVAAAYLYAAPVPLWRRLRQLLLAGLALVVSAGWWFLLVELWPADSRPYIGGSKSNSAWDLAVGYNGATRLFGPGSSGSTPSGASAMLETGSDPGRLFGGAIAGQSSWLLPAALVLGLAAIWVTRRAGREDRVRASLIVWGGWTVMTSLVFSLMPFIHEYYTVALAPGIAGLTGVGFAVMWRRRDELWARVLLAVTALGTGVWSFVLLDRSADFVPWLRWVLLVAALTAAIALLLVRFRGGLFVAVAAAAITGLGGSTAYAVQTAGSTYHGGMPVAGPSTGSSSFGPGSALGAPSASGGSPGSGMSGGFPPGGLGDVDPQLKEMLKNAGTRWAAAAVSYEPASSLSLASGKPVMEIAGFSGSDPYPTLEQFKRYVGNGEVRYFVTQSMGLGAGGDPSQLAAQLPASIRDNPEIMAMIEKMGSGGGMMGGGPSVKAITDWVKENFSVTAVGSYAVYDLKTPKN